MNGALCSQSKAHPWWKLLKTIAGIEAHELNTEVFYTTLVCWTEMYCKLEDTINSQQEDSQQLKLYIDRLQIHTFRYFLRFHWLKLEADAARMVTNTFLQHLCATLSKHMYTQSCKGFCFILLFYTGSSEAIIFPKTSCILWLYIMRLPEEQLQKCCMTITAVFVHTFHCL